MTLWSSPHPKESPALSLGQAQQGSEIGKIKELSDAGNSMPSANSFASDGSEDEGFGSGSLDVDIGEEETEDIQIGCIQTLTEFEPLNDGDLRDTSGSPLMSDCKTPIPLPPPPIHIGSGAFGGNQAYVNIQNTLPRIMERPSSPLQPYWGSNSISTNDSTGLPSRAPGDVGLSNIGNTCFMNSGLQCLVHTSPLVEFFVGSDSFERTATSLVYQFNSLMKHVWFGDKGAISLHDFKLVLGNKYVQFKDCRQHDCQEFLAVLLDMLHEELKSKQKSISIADSSVVESFDECLMSEETQVQDDNYQSVELDIRSDCIPQSSNDTNSSQNFSKSEEKCPLNKRLKLEEGGECDSGPEATTIVKCNEMTEVKRKSPVSKPGQLYRSETQANNILNEPMASGNTENERRKNVGDDSNVDRTQIVCPIQKAQLYWDNYMKENNTVIASTFQGMFKSAVTCSECSFISETYEPFMYLSLPIPRVMEKQINVTFISMKDRNHTTSEVTLHLMGTVGTLIQEVVRKFNNSALDKFTKYAAAEVVNHRVFRVLDENLQLRNLSTNSRNIYVYELNNNFDESINENECSDTPPKLEREVCDTVAPMSDFNNDQKLLKSSSTKDWEGEALASTSSSLPVYGPVGAPVGGGLYDIASTSKGAINSGNNGLQNDNDNFNKIQCKICLEDFSRSDLRKHRGCSCVLCEECLSTSEKYYQLDEGRSQGGSLLKCAVCTRIVDKKAFISLDNYCSTSSPPDFITMSILFRNDPGTDANNNSSWTPGLFGYPWLIRVPSFLSAADLVEYIELINPAPDVNHRLLSVKSDGKSCGQCVFSTRCNGCEIPKEGMISLNSSNSILISFVGLPPERMEQMQPPDMALHNELSTSWQYSRNEEPTIDIHDCLRTFSETEHLDEQNPWFCPRCEKNQRATKALSICKFPDYLIIYLKRFVFLDRSSNKLNNRLTFPISDLDVSDYVTEGFGRDVGKYNLYSCVCHFGSASAGHYTAYAKNPVTNQWHYFNDDDIVERAPAENEYASAYVLFYEKQGMGCNIPIKCSGQLPELNTFNTPSTFTADTRGSYLPGEPSVSTGPVRVDGDFINEMTLQVDSTTSNFTFPHASTETDLLDLEVDEGVGNETSHLVDIPGSLDLTDPDAVVVTSSTSGPDEDVTGKDTDLGFDNLGGGDSEITTSTEHHELPSSSGGGGADSTSNE